MSAVCSTIDPFAPAKHFWKPSLSTSTRSCFFFENQLLERGAYLKVNPDAEEEEAQILLEQQQARGTPQELLEEDHNWLGGVYLPNVPPISGQRISELFARVTRTKTDAFFQSRFKTLMAAARSSAPKTSKARALACDQKTGEVLFAVEYRGSVNDNASLGYILDCMKDVGMNFPEIMLVTDRGYKSMFNIQKQIDEGLQFVTGCPITEDALKALFDKHSDELKSYLHYVPGFDCSVVTETEPWQQKTESGQIVVHVKTHLYYSDQQALDDKRRILANADELLEAKQKNRKVDPKQWADYGKLICNIGSKDAPSWVRDSEAIGKRLRYAGCFAIKTNAFADPWEALTAYRQRNKVESLYRILKSDLGGERLSVTGRSCSGKIFAFVLAMSLRCMMSSTLRRVCASKKIPVPSNSLDAVLSVVRGLTMHRSAASLRWMPDLMTKKQREYLALLDVVPLKRRWHS